MGGTDRKEGFGCWTLTVPATLVLWRLLAFHFNGQYSLKMTMGMMP